MTDCDRLLAVLQDGNPHTHHELYKLGMIVHSRVADLRKRGYNIRSWKAKTHRDHAGRDHYAHFYRLVTLDAPDASPAPPTAEAAHPNHHPGRDGLAPASGASSVGDPPIPSPSSALDSEQLELLPARRAPEWA